jgi:hypothetical protein
MIQGLQHDTRHRFVSKTGRFRGAESAEKQGKQEVLGLLHTLEAMGSKLRRTLLISGWQVSPRLLMLYCRKPAHLGIEELE